MLLVNSKSSNEALLASPEVVAAVQGGSVILIDKIPTANPNYVSLYFAGMVETASSSTVGKAQAMLLGWTDNSQFLMRAMQNAATEIADKLETGKVFNDFALQIIDTNTPGYESHTPRQSKTGEVYVDESGKPIYRTARLVTKDELANEGHQVIKRVQNKAVGSVKAAELLATF
jgi:hypothetical protein